MARNLHNTQKRHGPDKPASRFGYCELCGKRRGISRLNAYPQLNYGVPVVIYNCKDAEACDAEIRRQGDEPPDRTSEPSV